jgi:integrase
MERFRARKQKSGTIYYYFDTAQRPRKEIPLGSDYVLAVRKWADLIGAEEKAVAVSNFEELACEYERLEIPKKAKSTQSTNRSDLKLLRQFFNDPTPAPLDQIKPPHIRAMLRWKGSQPTTANRLKRLFSHMFNIAREWGYTQSENPVKGIKGFALGKREVYVSDAVFMAVYRCASQPLKDAMDLAYLTGQRPGDVLKFTERQIADGVFTIARQSKTGTPLRIRIEGEFGILIDRITRRKAEYKVWSAALAVNLHGMAMTKQVLRTHFGKARTAAAAAASPQMAGEILKFWFYDLRAKAADDVSDDRGDQAAANLLGHANVATTQRHYLRRGKRVGPTK